jgi:hypothetical protein
MRTEQNRDDTTEMTISIMARYNKISISVMGMTQ